MELKNCFPEPWTDEEIIKSLSMRIIWSMKPEDMLKTAERIMDFVEGYSIGRSIDIVKKASNTGKYYPYEPDK